jgi:hypothetical protein
MNIYNTAPYKDIDKIKFRATMTIAVACSPKGFLTHE